MSTVAALSKLVLPPAPKIERIGDAALLRIRGKSEKDPASQEKLKMFREKVCNGRLVKLWNNAGDLPALVTVSLAKTIKTFPAIGWVRADKVANVLYPLSTLPCVPRDTQRKTRGRADRYSFLVRLFHPLLHAGLARRTVIAILRQQSRKAIALRPPGHPIMFLVSTTLLAPI